MKILIVDDEILIREVIKEYTSIEGYEVTEAANGLEAIKQVEKNDFDIIIMDIMMPHLDGYQAIKKIKDIKNIPCIILSARDQEYDKLAGFEIGIDDYLTKPFSPRELIARIKAITNRTKKSTKKHVFGTLILDEDAHEVRVGENVIDLTPKEYDLLLYLIKNERIALSREQILKTIWGYDYYGNDRTIDTHIKTLRNNLGQYRNTIKTVRGMGYKFEFQK